MGATASFWPAVKKIPGHLWRAINQWQQDDGGLLSAAVSYYGVLSFFPLLMILTAVLGFVLEYSSGAQNAQEELLRMVSQNASAQAADQLRDVLAEVRNLAPASGPIGLVVLLMAAMGIFANFEKAFDKIWNVPDPQPMGFVAIVRSILWQRLRAFVMLVALGLAVVAVFVTGFIMSAMDPLVESLPGGGWLWKMARIPLTVFLNLLLVTAIYRVLSKAPVRWFEAAQGAVLVVIVWEIARQLLSMALMQSRYTAYGVIGSMILVMLWVYAAVALLFLGAEYVQVVCEECRRADEVAHTE